MRVKIISVLADIFTGLAAFSVFIVGDAFITGRLTYVSLLSLLPLYISVRVSCAAKAALKMPG